eukprot:2712720-Prymnesium_polylepis.1
MFHWPEVVRRPPFRTFARSLSMSTALAALPAAADALRAATVLAADDVTVGLALCDEIAKLLAAR